MAGRRLVLVDRHHGVVPLVGRRVVVVEAAARHHAPTGWRRGTSCRCRSGASRGRRSARRRGPCTSASCGTACIVLEAVLLEPRVGDRVALGPAEVGRHRAVPLPVDRHDAAEQLRLAEQVVVRVLVARVAAALVADLQQLAGLAGGEHHRARALERVRHLLLAVHVLAGLQAVDRVLRVPEVGRRDHDRVELLLLVEHLPVVFVAVHVVLELLQRVDDALLVVLGPDVAHGAEAQPGDAQHRVGQHLALRAGAEQRDVDLLQVLGRRRAARPRRPPAASARSPSASPGVAEQAERGHRRQPEQHVAAVDRPPGAACRRARPAGAGCGPFLSSSAIVFSLLRRRGRRPRPRRSGSGRSRCCPGCTGGRSAPWRPWRRPACPRRSRCSSCPCPRPGPPCCRRRC